MDETHEDETPQTCACQAGMMAIVGTADGRAAAWCIWCGIGFGDSGLMVLHAGQPMTDVEHLEVTIPILIPFPRVEI